MNGQNRIDKYLTLYFYKSALLGYHHCSFHLQILSNIMPIKNIIIALCFAFSLSGCSFLYDTFVYQIDITQGNYIDNEKITQLELGMTQEQIIFVLGSPMLIDQFDSSKWYYIRYIKPGGEDIQQQQVLLMFADRILVDIKNGGIIEANPLIKPNRRSAPNEAAESSAEDKDPVTDNAKPVVIE